MEHDMTTLTLTAPQIASFFHHCCHIIPVSRGYAQQWRDEHAPGWQTNVLIGALAEVDAIERGDGHFSGWRPVADRATFLERGVTVHAE